MAARIDRLFGDLGRFAQKPTNDPKTRRRVDDMLSDLYDGERRNWPVLKALIDGRLDTLKVYEAFRGGQPLPSPEAMEPLLDAMRRWLPSVENQQTREKYEWAIERLTSDSGAVLADVPALLETYRGQCELTGTRRTFNLTRSCVQSLLRDTVGRGSELYQRVTSIRPLRLERRIGGAQSPETIATFAERLGPHGEMLWDLCLTGMRKGEYFPLHWRSEPDRIVVDGTKTLGSKRYVPLTRTLAGPTTGYDWFSHALRRVSDGAMRVHDTRKTYAHWLEEAGLPRTRLRMYLGHGRRDVTDIYTEHDVRRYLKPDAELLKTYVGSINGSVSFAGAVAGGPSVTPRATEIESHENSHDAPVAQLVEQVTLNLLPTPLPLDEVSPFSTYLDRNRTPTHTESHTP